MVWEQNSSNIQFDWQIEGYKRVKDTKYDLETIFSELSGGFEAIC